MNRTTQRMNKIYQECLGISRPDLVDVMYQELTQHLSDTLLYSMDSTNLYALMLLYSKAHTEFPDKNMREKLLPKMLRVSILTHDISPVEEEVKPQISGNVVSVDFRRNN